MNEENQQETRRTPTTGTEQTGFSSWDSLASRGQEIELALAYGRAFWPELVEVQGYVLVAEHYDEDYFQRVLNDVGSAQLESTINTTYLRNLFGDKDADESVWEALGEILTQSWEARAEAMFPRRRFRSVFEWYSDTGDPGITLYQE